MSLDPIQIIGCFESIFSSRVSASLMLYATSYLGVSCKCTTSSLSLSLWKQTHKHALFQRLFIPPPSIHSKPLPHQTAANLKLMTTAQTHLPAHQHQNLQTAGIHPADLHKVPKARSQTQVVQLADSNSCRRSLEVAFLRFAARLRNAVAAGALGSRWRCGVDWWAAEHGAVR